MKDAGVQIERYPPAALVRTCARLNNRTHRKLLVVDGTSASPAASASPTSGAATPQDAEHWRDTHFRVEGPVVAQMQAVFMDNWIKATGRVLHGEDYFPALRAARRAARADVQSSPTGGSESMQLMYLMAITAAERSVDLSSSYFVPDELAVRALVAAAKRGVEGAHHRAGPAHRRRRSCAARRVRAGATCSKPASRSPSTSRRCTTAR